MEHRPDLRDGRRQAGDDDPERFPQRLQHRDHHHRRRGDRPGATHDDGQTGADRIERDVDRAGERATLDQLGGRRAECASSADAVNGAQLYALGSSLASNLGGGATYNTTTGAVTNPTYTIGGSSYTTIGDALTAINTDLSSITGGGASVKYFLRQLQPRRFQRSRDQQRRDRPQCRRQQCGRRRALGSRLKQRRQWPEQAARPSAGMRTPSPARARRRRSASARRDRSARSPISRRDASPRPRPTPSMARSSMRQARRRR